MIEADQIARLRTELEPIYRQHTPFGFDRYTEPWLEPVCRQWSEAALPIAQAVLREADLVIARSCPNPARTTHALPFNFTPVHYYILDRSTADPLCIDGTYLQFSASTRGRQTAEHILVEHASSTTQTVRHIGIAAIWHFQWRPDVYRRHIFSTYPADRPLRLPEN